MSEANPDLEKFDQEYRYGFVTDIEQESAPPGLSEDIVRRRHGPPDIPVGPNHPLTCPPPCGHPCATFSRESDMRALESMRVLGGAVALSLLLAACPNDTDKDTSPTGETGTEEDPSGLREDIFVQALLNPLDIVWVYDPNWTMNVEVTNPDNGNTAREDRMVVDILSGSSAVPRPTAEGPEGWVTQSYAAIRQDGYTLLLEQGSEWSISFLNCGSVIAPGDRGVLHATHMTVPVPAYYGENLGGPCEARSAIYLYEELAKTLGGK